MAKMTGHAGGRLACRYNGVITSQEVLDLVRAGKYNSHISLTHTRTLCSVVTKKGPVYFVYNKRIGLVVTVLSREQAKEQFSWEGREWPALRGRRKMVLVVDLMEGPDRGKWEFRVREVQPEDRGAVYFFKVLSDVGLSGDYILELAWEYAPHPERVRDIMLSDELAPLFREEN